MQRLALSTKGLHAEQHFTRCDKSGISPLKRSLENIAYEEKRIARLVIRTAYTIKIEILTNLNRRTTDFGLMKEKRKKKERIRATVAYLRMVQ